MAAFTNQFERTNPFLAPSVFDYYGWLYQLWEETSQLLTTVSQNRRIAIARQIESLLVKSVEQRNFTKAGGMQRVAQGDIYKDTAPEHIRALYGDFNLFKEVHDSHSWDAEKVASAKWERFSVFSLWKLCDAFWEDASLQSETGLIDWSTERGVELHVPNVNLVMSYCFEAMRAHQVAETTLLMERLVSDRNRENGILANPNAEANRLRALKMAEELPFRSMNKAAEHIADNLVKGMTKAGKETFYGIEWIKVWLRDAAWTPQHKRKAHPK